jgi:hypothetical protein
LPYVRPVDRRIDDNGRRQGDGLAVSRDERAVLGVEESRLGSTLPEAL